MPKVSVIIPTYNRAKYLPKAIDSVLNQTYQDFEIIIVDDGSIDNTKDILAKYDGKIRYFYQENKGPSAARNLGIKKACGEYVAFLDADDIWFPDKLDKQLGIFNNDDKIGLVHSQMYVISNNNLASLSQNIKPKRLPGSSFAELLFYGSGPPSTFMVKHKCFKKTGLFDKNLKTLEDLDMAVRIARFYKVVFIPFPLGSYRQHTTNTTLNTEKVYKGQVSYWAKALTQYAEEVPTTLMKEKLAENSYLLGKVFFNKDNYVEANRSICRAIRICPYVSLTLISLKTTLKTKIVVFIKPYLALIFSIILSIFPHRFIYETKKKIKSILMKQC